MILSRLQARACLTIMTEAAIADAEVKVSFGDRRTKGIDVVELSTTGELCVIEIAAFNVVGQETYPTRWGFAEAYRLIEL